MIPYKENQPSALTFNLVAQKCKTDNFRDLKSINFWGCELEDVSLVKQLPSLEVVSLSVNKIKTLADFASCAKIKELFLRKNCIEDIREVWHLKSLKNLTTVWLSDNPCTADPNYRLVLIRILPWLVKIDSEEISEDERQAASKLNLDPYYPAHGLQKKASEHALRPTTMHQVISSSQTGKKSPYRGSVSSSGHNTKSGVSRTQSKDAKNSGHTPHIKRVQLHQERASSANQPRVGSSMQKGDSTHQHKSSHHQLGVVGRDGQISQQQQSHQHSRSSVGGSRQENIIQAIHLLISDLDESGLELIWRDIDKQLRK